MLRGKVYSKLYVMNTVRCQRKGIYIYIVFKLSLPWTKAFNSLLTLLAILLLVRDFVRNEDSFNLSWGQIILWHSNFFWVQAEPDPVFSTAQSRTLPCVLLNHLLSEKQPIHFTSLSFNLMTGLRKYELCLAHFKLLVFCHWGTTSCCSGNSQVNI